MTRTYDALVANERIAFVQTLVDGCLSFLKALTGIELYTYQLEIADRIFFSLLYGDAEEITIECSRQSGKSETLANVAATAMIVFPKLAAIYPEDPVIKKFKGGIQIGCFAPIDLQADTIFGRISERLSSEQAKTFMSDPEINDSVRTSGSELRSRSGSVCRRQTAHATAKIESKTYHLIIIDEAQEADSTKVRKSIHPMAVATAGSIIKVGTPAAFKSDFYEAIQRNKQRSNTHGKRNHFAYDWRRAAKENPYYAQSIKREKERLGEDSDEFQMSYALKWLLDRGIERDGKALINAIVRQDRKTLSFSLNEVHRVSVFAEPESPRTLGFGFAGAWTIREQNRLLGVCFGLQAVNRA